jgi:hypothetical protein
MLVSSISSKLKVTRRIRAVFGKVKLEHYLIYGRIFKFRLGRGGGPENPGGEVSDGARSAAEQAAARVWGVQSLMGAEFGVKR